MTLTEDLLSKRELIVFIGVENHSTPYNPLLFNAIWGLPESLPSNNLLIIPINRLGRPYMLSNERMMCYERALWVIFVDSPFFTHYAFLFDTFPQTDDNNYFTNENLQFLQKTNCSSVGICDIGVYKSRSLVKLLNCAISSLGKYNITVCLVTILGYNSRGYTDIEIEDEHSTYQKEYYLHSDIEKAVTDDNFYFIQIDKKFKLPELLMICCFTKSQVEVKLQEIKEQAAGYIRNLKPLLDATYIKIFIESLNKGDKFDFATLENNLKEWGFKGDLIDTQWSYIYEKLRRNVEIPNKDNRGPNVQKLIEAISNNINSTINFVKSI